MNWRLASRFALAGAVPTGVLSISVTVLTVGGYGTAMVVAGALFGAVPWAAGMWLWAMTPPIGRGYEPNSVAARDFYAQSDDEPDFDL